MDVLTAVCVPLPVLLFVGYHSHHAAITRQAVFSRLSRAQGWWWGIGMAVCLLTGCQWRPPSPSMKAQMARIAIARIDEPQGQWLRQRLQSLCGHPTGTPWYDLEILCQTSDQPWALNRHGQATWRYTAVTASYRLIRKSDGVLLFSGQVRASGSMPVTFPYYSQTVAEQTVNHRLMEQLAWQLYRHLLVRLSLVKNSVVPHAETKRTSLSTWACS